MTPEERAERLVWDQWDRWAVGGKPYAAEDIAEAIREAVLEERERCISIVAMGGHKEGDWMVWVALLPFTVMALIVLFALMVPSWLGPDGTAAVERVAMVMGAAAFVVALEAKMQRVRADANRGSD